MLPLEKATGHPVRTRQPVTGEGLSLYLLQ